MDEYTVGGVADIISNKINIKKSKKGKISLKNKKDQVTVKRSDEGNDKPSKVALKSKKKKKNEDSLQLSVETNSTKNSLNEDGGVSKSKKRKKPLAEPENSEVNNEEIQSAKKIKREFLNLDHMPTDSEDEEGENVKKNLSAKTNSKQTDHTDSNENTIFVGNIPLDYNKQKICKIFSKYGDIQNARIRCVPIADINMSKKVAAIKKQYNPKRNSLVAYVRFKSLESAKAALKANGMVVDGHHLRVDMAEENQERDNKKAVFVGGLPFDIQDDELWNFFQNCGQINNVRVVRDSRTSMGKGFGYVNFNSTAAVELALQLNGLELKKRTINVKRCVKSRNKNKLNAFGKTKSEEMTNQLLRKKGKKFKDEKKNSKTNKNQPPVSFQGRTANVKQKKKKKLSKAALRQRKIVKILGAS